MGMDNTTTQRRDKGNGQYAYSAEAMCECGHGLGVHAAECRDGERPCFVGDFEDAECECTRFRKIRAKRSK
jgi:hypothetical protein